MTPWEVVIVLAMVVAVLAGLVSPAHADNADPGTTATYPDVTSFNPDITPYTVHVESALPGTLELVVDNVAQDVPPSGDVVPDFRDDGATVLKVYRCDPGCTSSNVRHVFVYRHFVVGIDQLDLTAGPRQEPSFTLSTSPIGIAAALDWRMVDDRGTVAASGSSPFTTDSGVTVAPQVPPTVAAGTYTFEWSVDGGDDRYGDLSAQEHELPLTWKPTADVGTIRVTDPDLYPVRDGYRDSTGLIATAPVDDVLTADVMDPHGRVVRHYGTGAFQGTGEERSVGYTGAGSRRPGTYQVRLHVADQAGNTSTATTPFRVHRERLVWAHYRRTIKASDTVVKRVVGACSSLASPATHGPRGSLGYYSQTRCTRVSASAVSTVNGAFVPASVGAYDARGHRLHQAYRNLRVSVTGAGAGGTRRDYAFLYYFDGHHYTERVLLPASRGLHPGELVTRQVGRHVLDPVGHPRIYWLLGLSSGSRYDVRSFTVQVDYRALR